MLFRRKEAPTRYQEDDFYWADRHLTDEQKLPESDLLKAVHVYASDFYSKATPNKGIVDFESLDETALLGLGMLLEEMAAHVLGATGDLAFVEGEEVTDVDDDNDAIAKRSSQPPLDIDAGSTIATSEKSRSSSREPEEQRKSKRRKLEHRNDRD